ncbi:MAG: Helix-turn-helix domain of resolvase, partial [Mycobacterium sp.]|nr:Helix-turn-helix domain of resolvase [Mycobacterium sp.]
QTHAQQRPQLPFAGRVLPGYTLRLVLAVWGSGVRIPLAPPEFSRSEGCSRLARRMHDNGESATTIATTLGVIRATVYRVLTQDTE